MQAAVVHEWGGPEVLQVEEAPDPVPRSGEVLVELRASSLNWHDIIVRRVGRGFSLPRILGIDGAGIRRDTGEEVIIYPMLGWGDREEIASPSFNILGDVADGTYAELVRVPEENVFAKPANLSWSEAAALPVAGLTAYRALFTRGKIQSGENVLVVGAGSGVSTFAVSLADGAGARVFVTSSSPDKIARSQALGAIAGVNYRNDTWIEELQELTGGIDVVIDGVGGNLQGSLACLRPGGRLVVFGASGGNVTEIDIPSFYWNQKSIIGTTAGSPREFATLLETVQGAPWRPVIDSERPLGEIRAAHERMEEGAQFGKIVLTID